MNPIQLIFCGAALVLFGIGAYLGRQHPATLLCGIAGVCLALAVLLPTLT